MPEVNENVHTRLTDFEKRMRVLRNKAINLGASLCGPIPTEAAELKQPPTSTVHGRIDTIGNLLCQTEDAIQRVENSLGLQEGPKVGQQVVGY